MQFTGSRGLMRFSQLILGFERNKQADGDDKNLSQIRVLKDRNFGQTGLIPTKYNPRTGRLTQRLDHEYNPKAPFTSTEEADTGPLATIGNNEVVNRELPF